MWPNKPLSLASGEDLPAGACGWSWEEDRCADTAISSFLDEMIKEKWAVCTRKEREVSTRVSFGASTAAKRVASRPKQHRNIVYILSGAQATEFKHASNP